VNGESCRPVTFDVVSPEFPSGAAWLVNCLLELRVPVWELWGFDTRAEWTELGDGTHRYTATHEPWKQTLAAAVRGRVVRFRPALAARFSHGWPWEMAENARMVIVVRDPRDALHSEWHRQRDNHGLASSVSFTEFVRRPFFDAPLSSVDMLWLYLHSWLGYRDRHPEQVFVLRFEDWKRDPATALRGVAAWLGIDATDVEVRGATTASEVGRLQQVEAALRALDPHARRFNRRGQPEEWRSAWTDYWYAAFGPHWTQVLDGFAYPPLLRTNPAMLPPDLADVLRWKGMLEPRSAAQTRPSSGMFRGSTPA